MSFNPHPSRRTGATKRICEKYRGDEVSILTRPEGRVQHKRWVGRALSRQVSILTRPEGRVQRTVLQCFIYCVLFQSSPVPKDGCNWPHWES